ncbi:biotin--[acetyl-CoA-carboxylase] ligase [Salinispirillum marinum]|uniref:Biotin--[acetyl-CoA-carboxylase] ligase n=2 Tax=Saccharospirillaceae TaxID=255527 RepID=A0ABV8BIB8_9GAMM
MDKISQYEHILKRLQREEFVSGSALAVDLGVSRTVINRRLQELSSMGLRTDAISGRGYRLDERVKLLDVSALTIPQGFQFQRHLITASTNDDVLALLRLASHPVIVTTEFQSGGRGRRGRAWQNAFGQDLAVSFGFPIEGVEGIKPYSVIAGFALAKALKGWGLENVGVKWPNDLYVNDGKIAGVLTELHTLPSGVMYVVMGVGMNINRKDFSAVDQAATSLAREMGHEVSRTDVLGLIVSVLGDLIKSQFAQYDAQEWKPFDVLYERQIDVLQGENIRSGIAQGVAHDGSLWFVCNGERTALNGGEISVRPK